LESIVYLSSLNHAMRKREVQFERENGQ